jgi:YVTN family beta-propeller protein
VAVISSLFRGAKSCCAACVVLVAGALAMAAPAAARDAYVANAGGGTVSVIDTSTNAAVATIPVGGEPVDVAISPNGSRAFVANKGADTVAVIDTATNTVVGTPIPLAAGSKPDGVAVTPNGQLVYVANSGNDTVSAIGTATNSVSGAPISVGSEPDGIAISPDGALVFVAQKGGNVSIVNAATRAVVGTVTDALAPSRIAIGPRGGRAFVTNSGESSVTAFNPANGAVIGGPIPVGLQPSGIAIAPNGVFAYAAALGGNTLTPIATSNNAASPAIAGFNAPAGVAIAPDGSQGYVANSGGGSVSVFSTATNSVTGSIATGATPTGVAVVPDQPPRASFLVTPQHRQVKKKLTFHAGASSDPDGRIVNYAWDFGDGKHAQGTTATRPHTYRKPGTYVATLVVTDNEGCSTEFVFTGQTASCNGSVVATATGTIVVANDKGPVLRLAGGRRQRVRGRINVFAQCPRESCVVHAGGVVVTTTMRRGIAVRGKRRLGSVRARLAAGAWGRLSLRVPPGARRGALRAMRSGGGAIARLNVVASGESGLRTKHTRYVSLVRPHAARRHR